MTERPLARLNNPITFADAPLERHLDRYRRAGFWLSDHIADWDPELRTGFVDLWPEYLELLTVADEDAFANRADPGLRHDRAGGRIHAVELYSEDTTAVHAALSGELSDEGVTLPVVTEASLATTPPGAGPDFYFLDLPQLPGTRATVMTSTFPGTAMRRYLKVAPNGVFALAGLTLVVEDPERAGAAWARVTAPGVHELRFLTTRQWEPAAGVRESPGVVCLHLLSEDPGRTLAAMLEAGWTRGHDLDGRIHLLPHPEDGVRFTVERGSVEEWLAARREVLGEELEVRYPPDRER